MKSGLAFAIAVCLAGVHFPFAYASTNRVTDFADKDFSAGEIVSALRPSVRTRGLTIGEDEAATPKVSLQLRFGINSAELSADAKRRIDVLGAALNRPELVNTNLILSGHTDVSGSYEHNLWLSQRRAEAVRAYLIAEHEVVAERLKAVGRGPNDLLDETHPRSPVNRRVQLAVAG